MQTFLPYTSFLKSAMTLDNKRLNKQILEGYQILNVLSNDDPKAGWRNHPAVKMWRGHEIALHSYVFVMVYEANRRGIKTDKNVENLNALEARARHSWGDTPPRWLLDDKTMDRITTTHKANLFIKDPVYYHEFEWAVHDEHNKPCCDKCNYFWVTHTEEYASV